MIRPFDRQRDTERVLEIWLQSNLEAHTFVPADYWRAMAPPVREQLLRAELWVDEDGGVIRGFAGMTGSYLAGLFVAAPFRSAGIGRDLLTHIKARRPAFTLQVYQQNRGAVRFYLREGLTVAAAGTDAETGQPELTMRWGSLTP